MMKVVKCWGSYGEARKMLKLDDFDEEKEGVESSDNKA